MVNAQQMLIDVTVAIIDNTVHSYWVILTGSCLVSQDVYRSKLERLESKYSSTKSWLKMKKARASSVVSANLKKQVRFGIRALKEGQKRETSHISSALQGRREM